MKKKKTSEKVILKGKNLLPSTLCVHLDEALLEMLIRTEVKTKCRVNFNAEFK